MATITVSKGYNNPTGWTSGETVTASKLNSAQTPTVAISDIVDADISASAAIAASKLAGTLDLSSKTLTLPDNSVATGKIADAAVTPAKLSGAQTGAAPVYGVRAWANIDGENDVSPTIGGTYTRAGTLVTVDTTAPHGLQVGHVVYLDFTSGGVADGDFTVGTVPSTTQFTVTHGTSGTASGNVSLPRRAIRASGNVANVAYITNGQFAVNFTTAMPSANYAVSLTGQARSVAGNSSVTGAVTRGSAQTTMAVRMTLLDSTPSAVNVETAHFMAIA